MAALSDAGWQFFVSGWKQQEEATSSENKLKEETPKQATRSSTSTSTSTKLVLVRRGGEYELAA